MSQHPDAPVQTVNSEPGSVSVGHSLLRIIGALLLMLFGGILVCGGLAALVLVHTVGIGKLIGLMLVFGLGMLLSGWATLQS